MEKSEIYKQYFSSPDFTETNLIMGLNLSDKNKTKTEGVIYTPEHIARSEEHTSDSSHEFVARMPSSA